MKHTLNKALKTACAASALALASSVAFAGGHGISIHWQAAVLEHVQIARNVSFCHAAAHIRAFYAALFSGDFQMR